MIIIVISTILGVLLAIAFDLYIPQSLSIYAAIIIISIIDSVMSACKSLMRERFNMSEFLVGFFGNSSLAALMVFLGKKIGLDLYYAVIIVFTMRIFTNFSVIKRVYIRKKRQKLKKC